LDQVIVNRVVSWASGMEYSSARKRISDDEYIRLSVRRKKLTGTVLCMIFGALAFFVAISSARGQTPRETPTSADLVAFLRRFVETRDNGKTTQYIVAFTDLNGDGIPEAIVLLRSGGWCGSGGCTALVLTPSKSSWRIVTKLTITRPPIRVLKDTTNGWHDITVWVRGGGIYPGYEALLCFDGSSYPSNPTVPPAQKLEREVAGAVVISPTQEAVPLYDDRSPQGEKP